MNQTTGKMIRLPALEKPVYNAEEDRRLAVVGKRISEARKAKGVKMRELQKLLQTRGVEVGYASLFRWENGETVPNAYQLLAICDALEIPDFYTYFMNNNVELNAEGMKKLSEYRDDLIASGKYKPQPITQERTIRYVEMPVSTLGASAGTGEFLSEENFVLMRFPENSVPAKADFAVRVVGDSMEPIYQDHQLVWVQVCNSLRSGEVGVFVYDGQGYIKVYEERQPDNDELEEYIDSTGVVHNQVALISYNSNYKPCLVTPETSFKICGRVLN